MLVVTFEAGNKKRVIFLKEKDYYIGREETNDIIINHIAISRKHLKISFLDGRWYISDLDSKNGTYIAGHRITNELYLIKNNDSGSIGGDIKLFFKIKDNNSSEYSKFPLQINFDNGETRDSNIIYQTKKELLKIISLDSEDEIKEKLKFYNKTLGINSIGIFKIKKFGKEFLLFENKIPLEAKKFKPNKTTSQWGENFIIEPLLGESKNVFYYIFFSHNKFDRELIDRLRAVLKILYFYKEKREITFEHTIIQNNKKVIKDFIVVSEKMKEIVRKAIRYASTGQHILITGETGTGKEIIAQLIMRESPRKNAPSETTSLVSLQEDLIDSELFGHKKGSFTGAIADHTGVFERNNGGIIFLDEISLLPLKVQEKLLRTVEYGDIFPIGDRPKKVDVHIIFATNENLEKLVKEGKFRKDLYYRINALKIEIPPLRERKEDIIPISEYYLELFLYTYGKRYRGMKNEVKEMLRNYPWEGNIRELRNDMLLIATNIEGEKPVEINNLPEKIIKYFSQTSHSSLKTSIIESLKEELNKKETQMILKALEITNGNKTKAAQILGMSRSGFLKKYKQLFK